VERQLRHGSPGGAGEIDCRSWRAPRRGRSLPAVVGHRNVRIAHNPPLSRWDGPSPGYVHSFRSIRGNREVWVVPGLQQSHGRPSCKHRKPRNTTLILPTELLGSPGQEGATV
jgi:hypothetical protein